MSRSNPEQILENPATRFFDWDAKKGTVVYYDKEAKENVTVESPFRFLILDEVMTVGGGVDDDAGFIGYWSNMVRPRDGKFAQLVVRSSSNKKTRIEMTGTWKEIKAQLTGSKYIKGLYIAYYEGGELALGYLKIRGACLKPWMEMTALHRNIYEGVFSIIDKNAKKKGSNNYFEPVFAHSDKIKDETNEAAVALDKDILQPYLTAYFAKEAEPQQAMAANNYEYTGTQQNDRHSEPEFPAQDESYEPGSDYEDDIPF